MDIGCGVRVIGVQSKPEWNDCLGVVLGPPTSISENNVLCPILLQRQTSFERVLPKPSNLVLLHDEALDLLLEAEADITASNNSLGGRTVLHEACRVGDTTLAQKLLGARADLEQVDSKSGLSALHLAARGKHAEVLKLLIQAKAKVELPASNGKTAADFLKANGAGAEMLEMLSVIVAPTTPSVMSTKQDTLAGLTKEQRAALYLD